MIDDMAIQLLSPEQPFVCMNQHPDKNPCSCQVSCKVRGEKSAFQD